MWTSHDNDEYRKITFGFLTLEVFQSGGSGYGARVWFAPDLEDPYLDLIPLFDTEDTFPSWEEAQQKALDLVAGPLSTAWEDFKAYKNTQKD